MAGFSSQTNIQEAISSFCALVASGTPFRRATSPA